MTGTKNLLDCMTIVAGKKASKTGRVLLAHNEDDYTHAAVHHYYVPAIDHRKGEYLPAEAGRVRIPQVAKTFAYWWAQVNGPEGGLQSSDTFFNENGVCVVSDSSCGSREAAEADFQPTGGIVYELRRAIAERAKSARHGLQVAIELVRQYGYASSGRIYFIADKQECFVLQLVQGSRYFAARIPDDCICIMPNHYTLHGLKDAAETYASEDLISHAIEMGWYNPKDAETFSDFDFAEIYQDPKTYRHPENTLRQKYASEILLGRKWDTEKHGFPFCLKAEKTVSVRDLMRAMSSHYEGTRDDVRFGPGRAPHDTEVRRICTGTTVESQIYAFSEKPQFTTVWMTFGRPCGLPYIPLHPLCGFPENLETERDPIEEAATHFMKKSGATAHKSGYWQLFQDCQNAMEMRYSDVKARMDALKEKLLASFEQTEEVLFEGADGLDDTTLVRRAHQQDNENLRLAANAVCEAMYLKDAFVNARIMQCVITGKPENSAYVTFSCEGNPVESELLFGPGRVETHKDYARARSGSLKLLREGVWTAALDFGKAPLQADGAGTYEFILGGRTSEGESFTGLCLVKMFEEGTGHLEEYWRQSPEYIYVAGHRGWCACYPENTMEGFVAAAALGVDQIETDVRVTADGELVLMHDAELSRTTDGSGRIEDMNLAEGKRLDAGIKKGERFIGYRVPTLRELLELVRRHPFLTLDVELKEYPEDGEADRAYKACDAAIALIHEFGLSDRVVINSFSAALHKYIKEKYDMSVKRHEYYPPKAMKESDSHDYKGAYCCCMFPSQEGIMASEEEMIRMREKGVQPWAGAAVSDEEGVLLAIRSGAFLITCNDPDVVLRLLQIQEHHD